MLAARPGDSLARILAEAGIAPPAADAALAAVAARFSPRALQSPGREVTLQLDPTRQGGLLGLAFEPEPGRRLRAWRGAEGGWTAAEDPAPQAQRHLVLARGEVRDAPLVASLEAAGLPAQLALGLLRALSHAVDLQREVRPGDRFTILFERFRDAQGRLLRHGEILHAAFALHDRRLSAWRHAAPGEAADDWYDDEGQSLRRAFLRTPLDGARLTSGFGRRLHPILGFTRGHQGVDFAAPRGTPVYAAADGAVVEASRRGGYGLAVRLLHPGGAETVYAHLSAFARGLKPGDRLRQGELVGRVGATGLATGPHLHFELHMDGRPVDPATIAALPAARLEGAALAAFLSARHGLQAQLARLAPMEEVASAD